MNRRPLVVVAAIAALALSAGCPPRPGGTGGGGDDDGGPGGGNSVATCDVGGVDVRTPTKAAERQDGEPLDVSCIGAPVQLGAGSTATLEGCIEIFGLGGKAKQGLKLALFTRDQDPSTDDPSVGEVDIATKTESGALDCVATPDAPACRAVDCPKEGFYRIANVPTHEPLIMKVYDSDEGTPAQTAIATYTYDLVFLEADKVDGVIDYEANLIYRTTYDSIPTLAGKIVEGQQDITDGQGRGVIAGEVHDCADVIVGNATIATSNSDAQTKVTYFNGDEEDPTPDLTLNATNTDGLYVILNAKTADGDNEHTIAAGYVDQDCEPAECQCKSLSARDVRVFPDSVTIVTLRGDVPEG